jgi:hypothetical protein
MATVKVSGAGARQSKFWALNSSGDISGDQSGANGYDGVRLDRLQSGVITIPDIQPVVHVGDDRPFAQDFLPPNALPSATLTTAASNLEDDATLTATLVEELGDIAIAGMATDKQGSEIDVCLFITRQALDTDRSSASQGSRRWLTYVFPKCRIVPKGGSAEQGAADPNNYNVVPSNSTKKPWGVSFTNGTNGFTESPLLRMVSENPLAMERWTGDGSTATFNLQNTPITAAKTKVWFNGTAATVNSVDVNAKTVTLSAAPANNSVIIGLYEHTDGI